MTVSADIYTAFSSLQDQVQAASPLSAASRPTILAIQLNAGNLVAQVQSALTPATSLLDTWTAPVDAPSMITGVLSVYSAGLDQSTLSLMRGVAGRAASNVNQLV